MSTYDIGMLLWPATWEALDDSDSDDDLDDDLKRMASKTGIRLRIIRAALAQLQMVGESLAAESHHPGQTDNAHDLRAAGAGAGAAK